jgi:phage terminase large subunit
MSELNLKATTVFQRNWEAINGASRFIINEGGSRSSKTYSLCQVIILYLLQNPGKTVSVVRASFPSLRATVMRDFFEVMQELDLYDVKNHSKTEHVYSFPNKSKVEFFSADQEQKLRGRKRDICWVNESNELDYESFQQLNMRTNEKVIVDYNPSAVESYLYHLPEDKSTKIHSTYQDNPFLSREIIEEIQGYQYSDPDYYQIFTLGQRCFSRENVYNKWDTLEEKPPHLSEFVYGIDFGYTHPTAMVKIWYHPNHKDVFIEELIYESHLTSGDILEKFRKLSVDSSRNIIAETARPEVNADLRREGYRVTEAIKDVKDGILNVKSFRVYVHSKASNVIKENFNYRYKKVNGIILEEPIKLFDDAMDAIRYALMWVKRHGQKSTSSTGQIYSFEI